MNMNSWPKHVKLPEWLVFLQRQTKKIRNNIVFPSKESQLIIKHFLGGCHDLSENYRFSVLVWYVYGQKKSCDWKRAKVRVSEWLTCFIALCAVNMIRSLRKIRPSPKGKCKKSASWWHNDPLEVYCLGELVPFACVLSCMKERGMPW